MRQVNILTICHFGNVTFEVNPTPKLIESAPIVALTTLPATTITVTQAHHVLPSELHAFRAFLNENSFTIALVDCGDIGHGVYGQQYLWMLNAHEIPYVGYYHGSWSGPKYKGNYVPITNFVQPKRLLSPGEEDGLAREWIAQMVALAQRG